MLKAIPIELKDAQAFINEKHRHHIAAHRDKFRIGCEHNGKLVGVAQVGRPVARGLDDGLTLEVLRLCSDGSKDVCSFLYSRAARIAKELGYKRIITYILSTESGSSLKAAGWQLDAAEVGGGSWSRKSRPRDLKSTQLGIFEERQKYPTEIKQRWIRWLN